MQGNRNCGGRAILAAAAVGLAWLAGSASAHAGAPQLAASALGQDTAQARFVEKVIFYHRRRPQELYCVEGSRWWYYRPYQNADDDYPRCMPYFKYPSGQAGAYAPSQGGLK